MVTLDGYIKNRSVWRRPGTEDDLVVRYLLPPGLRVADVEDPAAPEVVSIDCYRRYCIIGYADGCARTALRR